MIRQFVFRVDARQAGDRMKHIADLVLACALLALTLPLMAIVAFAIKLDSPGPVFAHRKRLGLGGRQIRVLKFRTTVHDPQCTLRQNAPLTQVGSFLLHTHLNNLPQVVNVLRGELSFVGTGCERPNFLR
jgi:lipopolysaccharide/colanic/teichoic acid biosynthesis glycosyltransferase